MTYCALLRQLHARLVHDSDRAHILFQSEIDL